MKNQDHLLLAIGSVIIIASYIINFQDLELGGFLQGLGYGLILSYILKALFTLISKKRTNETIRR